MSAFKNAALFNSHEWLISVRFTDSPLIRTDTFQGSQVAAIQYVFQKIRWAEVPYGANISIGMRAVDTDPIL